MKSQHQNYLFNFHWMLKDNLSIKETKELFLKLEESNYKSVLLTFQDDQPDTWIKASHTMSPIGKMKYMVALRPYALTPAYCVMLTKAFNQISNNKLILNMIAGTTEIDQQVFESPKPMHERLLDCERFIINFKLIWGDKEGMPEVAFTGSSLDAINHTNNQGDISLFHISNYVKHIEQFKIIKDKKKIARAWVIIANTDDEAERIFNGLEDEVEIKNCIYGSEDTIYQKMCYYKDIGIDEFMITCLRSDIDLLHGFVKKYSNN